MPCATIHLIVADRLLDAWSKPFPERPFDPGAADQREAFLHGTLAPDMGFIPGVDRFVSELAHYVRPARLATALLEAAATDRDRAFAWGWISHVVADVEIHPIVGRAVGERRFGDRRRRLDASEDCEAHVAIEVGLDITFLRRNPGVSPPPGRAHLDRGNVGQVARAFERTYGCTRRAWDEDELLRSHARAVVRTRRWPRALRVLSSARPGPWPGSGPSRSALLGAGLAAAAVFAPRGGALKGFLTASPPPGWMIEEVESSIDDVCAQMHDLAVRGAETLPDRNLETGGPAGAGLGHPASDEAVARLDALSPGERSPSQGDGHPAGRRATRPETRPPEGRWP